jgi:hypothetical protein
MSKPMSKRKMSANRTMIMRFFAIAVILLSANVWAQQRDPIIENIAKAYGLDSFDKIDAIRYTWSIDIPGLFKATHKWEWEPKTGKISFESTDKDGKPVKASYDSSQLNSQPDQVKTQVEPAFVNDNYWLLFPLHAYWDKSATITNEGMKKLPTGVGSATLVTVKYPAEAGGYTPGDTWDLYVGKDYRVKYLEFHHGGTKKPSRVNATWAGYKKAGPLLVSTEHSGTADGKPFHLWITNVAVKLTGSDKWIPAQ